MLTVLMERVTSHRQAVKLRHPDYTKHKKNLLFSARTPQKEVDLVSLDSSLDCAIVGKAAPIEKKISTGSRPIKCNLFQNELLFRHSRQGKRKNCDALVQTNQAS